MYFSAKLGFHQRFFDGFKFLILSFCIGAFLFNAAPSLAEESAEGRGPAAQRRTSEAAILAYAGHLISEIRLLGLKRIEKEAVLEKISSKKGQPLDRERVRADIQTLFDMGYFDDVEVRLTSQGSRRVRLTFILKERPVISEIIFEGNEKVSTEDLTDVIKLREYEILDINRVRNDIELIQRHYEDKGFYLAKVQFVLEIDEENRDQIRLIYKVNDYEKVEIKKVTFLNNKVFSDRELNRVFAETSEGGVFSFISGSGSFKESAFKQDLNRLTYWYLDNGYIKFRYENPVVTVTDDKRWLYISIYVEEGKQYKIRSLDFDGDLLFPKSELNELLTLREGEIFKISKRNADIQALTEKYQDLGYAFVNVIPKMNIDDETREVDITYSFEKGNLVYFGEINVKGNSKTRDKVIRRELRVHEGELYSGSNLRISRERVERLGYFQPGQVIFSEITRKGRDDIVDIEIQVQERSTGTITLGAGYGSVQKFFLTTQISEINLFGKGQTLSLQGQYAADNVSRSLNLGFTDPYAFDTRWSLGFDIFSINFPIPDLYLLRKLGFDIRLGRPIADDVNAFITYKNEGTKITEVDSAALPQNFQSLEQGILSSIVWSVVRDKRNNRFETTSGDYQSVSLETAGLGGDKKFVKWRLNNRVYFRIVGDLIFRNSTEYGQVTTWLDSPGVPISERFLLGGPNNMKGYEILSLGPKQVLSDGTVVPVGGFVEMFSLFELEYPLIREAGLKWVMFFDVGNAFNSFPGINNVPFTLRTDAGFGFRWFSPIGPLRFEWGFPFKKRADEISPVFSFFIGPPF